ncbi:MAG: J domain-containing protein [Burkholderiales bacterium]
MNPSATASLFDDEEPGTGRSMVEVLAQSKPVTKAQQAFHRLVAKIEGQREKLRAWQTYEHRYHQRLAGEMLPLQRDLQNGQRQMAALLDELLSPAAAGPRLGRVQRAKLRQMLLNLVTGLLEDGDDEAMEALHDKHADVPHAQARQSELELTQALLEGVFGMEVGDDHGASSTEELLEHAQRKAMEEAQAQARLAQEREGARLAKRSAASRAKAEAAQAQREQAELEVSQSLREVYRKLASALHPDREPDADARVRRTQMMQRVNQAYDAKDLLTLLGLQLEIEQIDAAHLASVSPQRLTHFTQILRDQLAELEAELEHCTRPFQHMIEPLGRRATLTPALVDQHFSADLANLRAGLRELQGDLVAFRDPARLREFLKHYELEQDDDPEELAEFMSMLDVAAAMPPRKPRRRS